MDFAYHVHTDVGNQMVGAKINGKLVNPDHLLANAEVVEILTYNGPPTSLSVARHHVRFLTSKLELSSAIGVENQPSSACSPCVKLLHRFMFLVAYRV